MKSTKKNSLGIWKSLDYETDSQQGEEFGRLQTIEFTWCQSYLGV